jgi:hypothetical protein
MVTANSRRTAGEQVISLSVFYRGFGVWPIGRIAILAL